MTKKTLYVSRPVLNAKEIYDWFSRQGVFGLTSPKKMHVTVAYSTAVVDWSLLEPQTNDITIIQGNEKTIETFGVANVLVLQKDYLSERWQEIMDVGASFSYAPYRPHITFAYGEQVVHLGSVEIFDRIITLGPEVFAELDEDWA